MSQPGRRPPATWIAFAGIWCVAFLVAIALDAPVARWARETGTADSVRAARWSEWVKAPGTFWFTAAVVALLWLARRIHCRQVAFAFAAAAVAGLNVIPKWVVGRTRPFKLSVPIADQPRPFELHPFWHGLWGLFHESNLSFPSGHECTAFALTAAVWVVWRPGAWALLPLAVAVGFERVAENAHYASDVVAAVGFAAAGTALARWALSDWMGARTAAGRL